MKLKELVANSLPRVRGKKKKSPTLSTCPVPFSSGPAQSSSPMPVTAIPDVCHDLPLASQASAILAASSYPVYDDGYVRPYFGGGSGLEPAHSRSSFTTFYPTDCHQPRRVVKDDPQAVGLKWHGNALYRGLHGSGGWDTTTEKIFSTEMVSSGFSRGGSGAVPYRGMTMSHSAEGISAHQLLSMSRPSYDARMAVSEYAGSCSSQMSVISESAVEAYSSALRQRQHYLHHQQQPLTNLNAHYHQHSHQHFHHYHHHHHHLPSRGMPLTQQQPPGQHLPTTVANQNSCNPGTQQRHGQAKGRSGKKQELGFFRKSFASLRSIRKHTPGHSNNNTVISPAPAKPGCVAPLTKANLEASEHLRCSVCPYPDQGGVTSANPLPCDNAEGRPVKPKRKGFRGLSKSKSKKAAGGKENRSESGEVSSCFSDNDAQSMIVAVGQPITNRQAPDFYPSWDRSRHHRECSVDSFSSSRVCDGSRESSGFRELDPSGFDSASMSGYDSDFPRGAKVNRSRSRIRTNPWLPSPQPALGVCGGSRRCEGGAGWKEDPTQLRESHEDMASCDDLGRFIQGPSASSRTIARSASFEHRRPATLKSLTSSYHPGCQKLFSVKPEVIQPKIENYSAEKDRTSIQGVSCTCSTANQRPLTPNVDPEGLYTMSLDRPQKTSSPAAKKPSWWSFGRRNSKKEPKRATTPNSTVQTFSTSSLQQSHVQGPIVTAPPASAIFTSTVVDSSSLSKKCVPDKHPNTNPSSSSLEDDHKMNDLNMETVAPVLRSRPRSIVSPNSEFVLLAGHLEQLANNISFEYEDVFDSLVEETSENRHWKPIKFDKDSCQVTDRSAVEAMDSPSTNMGSGLLNVSARNQISSNLCNRQECLKLSTPESPFSPTSACSLASPGLKTGSVMVNPAHSPDSGVGGLGSTDGDDSLSSSNVDRTPGSPQSDGARSGGVDFDQIMDKQLHHQLGAMTQNNGQFLSCLDGRVRKPLSYLKQGSEHQPSSFSSTQDDDSSATISESDVDNTHYHDGPSLHSTIYTTSPSKVHNYNLQRNNNSSHKNPSHYQNINLTTQRDYGVIMGPRASLQEHGMPSAGNNVSNADHIEDVSSHQRGAQKVACRPSHLNTQPAPQDNCTESYTSPTENNFLCQLPSKEMAIRKTSIESMESPDANFEPVTGRIVRTCHLDAAMILEANLKLVKAPSIEDSGFVDIAGYSRHNQQPLGPEAEDKESQTTADMVSLSGDVSCMDCTFSSREDEERSMNASFDMSDACVQTEFDEDFPRWDEVDALESLEESALDPAESTRRWLLTGNMLGSADTGYASQTRESQIFMDDDTRYLPDDTFLPWLCHSEDRASNHSSDERTPRNSACFDNDFDFASENFSRTTGLRALLEDGPVMYRPVPISKKDISSVALAKKAVLKHEKPAVPPKPRLNSSRSISPSTVDQMFCNIEQQFHDIFQHRREPRGYTSRSPNPKRFSDSSDSTLESECSADSSFSGGVPVGELHDVAARCRDMRTDSKSFEGEILTDSDSHFTKRYGFSNCSTPTQSLDKRTGGHTDPPLSKSPALVVDKKPTVSNGIQRLSRSGDAHKSRKEKEHNEDSFVNQCTREEKISSPKTDKADYLEFLLDTPLDRSYLKRPLFLVPGVGPVDISCSENMYSNTPFNLEKNQVDRNCLSHIDKSELNSSSTHLAKKSRFKDKTHNTSSDSVNSKPKQSVDLISPCSPPVTQDLGCIKSRSLTAADKKVSQPGHKPKHTTRNARNSLSFENKGYQRLGEHWMTKQLDRKSFPVAESSTPLSEDATSLNDIPEMEEETRILADRVQALKREKDEVYRKLQAAQLDELSRKGNLEELRRHAQSEHKETLLRTLRELRDKLEGQKKLLQEKVKNTGQKTFNQNTDKTPTQASSPETASSSKGQNP